MSQWTPAGQPPGHGQQHGQRPWIKHCHTTGWRKKAWATSVTESMSRRAWPLVDAFTHQPRWAGDDAVCVARRGISIFLTIKTGRARLAIQTRGMLSKGVFPRGTYAAGRFGRATSSCEFPSFARCLARTAALKNTRQALSGPQVRFDFIRTAAQ